MICNVCKNDHDDKNRTWCDRSDFEIKYDSLQSQLTEANKTIVELAGALEKANSSIRNMENKFNPRLRGFHEYTDALTTHAEAIKKAKETK
jgi:peptidoglycan hydrolase CwlO-like protein